MTPKSALLKSIAPVRIAYQALRHELQQNAERAPVHPDMKPWYDEMRETGICVVPNFLDRDLCNRLIEEIQRVARSYPAAVHHASNGADMRIFGADKASAMIDSYGREPRLMDLARAMLGNTAHNLFTLAGMIEASVTNLGSGEGWHRDSFFGQFKALIYLTDVNEDNGPFEYIRNSHRLSWKFSDRYRHRTPLHQPRVTDEMVAEILSKDATRLCTVTGGAGSIALVDTTGIHRGRPLRSGKRAALTNYYYRKRDVTPRLLNIFRPILGTDIPV